MKVVEYGPIYYTQVKDIYEKLFPEEERYITLEKIVNSPNTEL